MKISMPKNTSGFVRRVISHDLLASFVVFLVALPLCMGIAIASGVPVAAGLITGIVGGLVVGWIAGCPLQVSGPAAGLTVIVYEAVQTHGLHAKLRRRFTSVTRNGGVQRTRWKADLILRTPRKRTPFSELRSICDLNDRFSPRICIGCSTDAS